MFDVTVTKIVLSEPLVKQIKAEIGESIGKLGCGSDAGGNTITPEEIKNAVVELLIPLSENRIVFGIDEGLRVVPNEEVFNNPDFLVNPRSLIPVAFFIGTASCYVGSTIGSESTWIECRP